jgi:hypothetical protein
MSQESTFRRLQVSCDRDLRLVDLHVLVAGLLDLLALSSFTHETVVSAMRQEALIGGPAGTLFMRHKRVDDLGNVLPALPETEVSDVLGIADEIHLERLSYNSPLEIVIVFSSISGALALTVNRALATWQKVAKTREAVAQADANRYEHDLRRQIYGVLMQDVQHNAQQPIPEHLTEVVEWKAWSAVQMLSQAKDMKEVEAP